jgi:hypothetical protein
MVLITPVKARKRECGRRRPAVNAFQGRETTAVMAA